MEKEMDDLLDCGGCNKSLEELIYWKHVKRLRFCVVLPSDFQDKLPIPKKFAENMKPNVFHPKITLRGPSGASWGVTLMSSVDGLFLKEGWEEFANAYSLQESDILFFKYDRNSSFDVKIFNGQCEQAAAYFVKKCGHVSLAVKDQKKRASSEIIDDDDGNGDEVCNTTKKAPNDPRTRPHTEERLGDGLKSYVGASNKILSRRKSIHWALRYIRKKAVSRSSKVLQGGGNPVSAEPELTKDTDQSGSTNKEASSVDRIHPDVNGICTPDAAAIQKVVIRKRGRTKRPRSSKKKGSKKKTFATIEYISHRRPVTEEEKKVALMKAGSVPADKSFFAALPLSSCYKGFLMTIPAKFAAEHFHCKNEDVILRVGDKKWLTGFCFSTNKLASGWREFALDNNLEESDVCLFKLVSQVYGETMMLDVTIFRVVEEITPPTVLVTPPNPVTA